MPTSRLPTQCHELRFKVREPIGQGLAIAVIAAAFDLLKHSLTLEQQAVALALGFYLLRRELDFGLTAAREGGLDLFLHGLAFPAARHVSILSFGFAQAVP